MSEDDCSIFSTTSFSSFYEFLVCNTQNLSTHCSCVTGDTTDRQSKNKVYCRCTESCDDSDSQQDTWNSSKYVQGTHDDIVNFTAVVTSNSAQHTTKDISFEYTLINGKNDSIRDAEELAALLRGAFRGTGAPIHVNLIRVNEVKETGFKEGSVESANNFAKALEKLGVVATVRRRLGADVNAACGQLRRNNAAGKI